MIKMGENILKKKSYKFAVRIVNLYKYLCDDKREFILSKQLLISGTSVGAMIREAEYAESKSDFVHKMAIAQKEINETLYRLELMRDTEYISNQEFDSINTDAIEIIKIITTSIKTAKTLLPPLIINH